MKQKIRIAAGQGFWGDLPDAPVRQVEGGPIDYLMLDYLAEVTMSIMQKQKARDPNAGYAKDFVPLMRRILPACVERVRAMIDTYDRLFGSGSGEAFFMGPYLDVLPAVVAKQVKSSAE